ncbi:MAG: hypothetical protein HY561_12875 [Gemmatimonadetes bacterium]|nr:hypothetical protein [Gemmatimonadota bacterium]
MRPQLKKALLALGGLLALMVVAVSALGVHVARSWDRVYDLPLPAVTVSNEPNVVARGEYLV